MTIAEKNILESYFTLLEKLSLSGKIELMEMVAKSMKKNKIDSEKKFFESFGSFGSEKSAEEISKEIKESRKFRSKDLKI